MKKVCIFWFRRDLRLFDNTGLNLALQGDFPVLPVFIFDTEIIDELPKDDARIDFIYKNVQKIRQQLQKNGSSLAIYHGKPINVFKELENDYDIQAVYSNHDYEPYALKRDEEIAAYFEKKNIHFYSYKDQVIFEKDDILKGDGTPYVVYTPYMKLWKTAYKKKPIKPSEVELDATRFYQNRDLPNPSLSELGFTPSSIEVPEYNLSPSFIEKYGDTRNIPGDNTTSRLGPHLRFGTVSIREVVEKASEASDETFLQELIWREFFMQILWHYPETVDTAFKKEYDRIKWRNNQTEFNLWKEGKTGYPIVDAGMRQLNKTGFMHNRVRMVVASFLCKHLLIDWRWGEGYFAEKLLDYELSSNVGNWQWAAGSGVDAAPYFRIFNPTTQLEKFDSDHSYIKTWLPEFGTDQYPSEIVDHKEARERCLKTYKEALS